MSTNIVFEVTPVLQYERQPPVLSYKRQPTVLPYKGQPTVLHYKRQPTILHRPLPCPDNVCSDAQKTLSATAASPYLGDPAAFQGRPGKYHYSINRCLDGVFMPCDTVQSILAEPSVKAQRSKHDPDRNTVRNHERIKNCSTEK